MLPEYSNDPRVVKNLLDGVNQTRDDLHMWLAPFTPGQDHTVTILFPQPTIIALIRLWVRYIHISHCSDWYSSSVRLLVFRFLCLAFELRKLFES